MGGNGGWVRELGPKNQKKIWPSIHDIELSKIFLVISHIFEGGVGVGGGGV